MFINLLLNPYFKFSISKSVPYIEIFPNAKSKGGSSSRTVTMVRLRHPEKSIDDLFENMENEHDKSEETTGNTFPWLPRFYMYTKL